MERARSQTRLSTRVFDEPKTNREPERRANQQNQAVNWSSSSAVLTVLGTGLLVLAISLTLFGLVWLRLSAIENSLSVVTRQLEPVFKKHYKEIAAANGISAYAVEAIPLTQSASRRITISAEGKSMEGAFYNLSYTFIRVRAGMLWFDEVIRVNDKVIGPIQVTLPLTVSAAVRVAGTNVANVTLPALFIAVIDWPSRNLAVVALGSKRQESKPPPG